jgi:hypothetical protein
LSKPGVEWGRPPRRLNGPPDETSFRVAGLAPFIGAALVDILEPLALGVYALLAAILAIAGVDPEVLGLTGGATTHGVPGLWLWFVGTVALDFGYLLTQLKLLARLRDVASRPVESKPLVSDRPTVRQWTTCWCGPPGASGPSGPRCG